MALVGLAVIIERWRSLKMLGNDTAELKNSVLMDLTENRIEEASPVANKQLAQSPPSLQTVSENTLF